MFFMFNIVLLIYLMILDLVIYIIRMMKTSEVVIHSFISILLATSLLMVMQTAPFINAQQSVTIVRAKVILTGNVTGTLDVTESSNQTGVRFVGQVTGLTPGKHGFHIHQFGDIFSLEQCLSTGAHYNPANVGLLWSFYFLCKIVCN